MKQKVRLTSILFKRYLISFLELINSTDIVNPIILCELVERERDTRLTKYRRTGLIFLIKQKNNRTAKVLSHVPKIS
jgi:hypothetical protein